MNIALLVEVECLITTQLLQLFRCLTIDLPVLGQMDTFFLNNNVMLTCYTLRQIVSDVLKKSLRRNIQKGDDFKIFNVHTWRGIN